MENPTVYKPSAQAFVRSARNQRVMIRSPTEKTQGRGSAGRECRGAGGGAKGWKGNHFFVTNLCKGRPFSPIWGRKHMGSLAVGVGIVPV